MMSLGPIGFLQPALLAALLALPLVWWLLRFTPPRPQLVVFPPTRLLKDIEDTEQTPQHSPWWLTALRVLLAALLIVALAGPVLYPDRGTLGGSGGPLVLVVDNGWAAATHWDERRQTVETVLRRAESAGRPVILAASAGGTQNLAPVAPQAARQTADGLTPRPYAPRRLELAERLREALDDRAGISVVWLSDGLDYGDGADFAAVLEELSADGGSVHVAQVGDEAAALALHADSGTAGGLTAHVVRGHGAARGGMVNALSARGERLSEAPFELGAGERAASAQFDLPLEIRNQIARLEIAEERSAGAVHLLDARSQWRRVGIVSGESRELAQPLLSPLYYVERALDPYAEVALAEDGNVATAVRNLLERNLSVLALADIGTLVGSAPEDIESWVERGGTLVRFAGPRLEQSSDDLLPTPLRQGGRTLGGSLSWSAPQPLAPFEDESPFHGLAAPEDVTVHRQVLADPTGREDGEVWARLQDGTPLVSAARRGDGWLVLFHVTANSEWSNLPMSGLFVEMLRRIVDRSTATSARPQADAPATVEAARADAPTGGVLAPAQVLDGFGQLTAPPSSAAALRAENLERTVPGPEHPPGYYGPAGAARALNAVGPETVLEPLTTLPQGASAMAYGGQAAVDLKPWALAAAFGVFLADMLAILVLMGGLRLRAPRATAQAAAAALLVLALVMPGGMAAAQMGPTGQTGQIGQPGQAGQAGLDESDKFAMEAALNTRLAYVVTGDSQVDRASQLGLSGLGKVLAARTAVEPAEPVGVDIDTDELAFFPLLYWPVLDDAQQLRAETLARVDAFMKQGGMILFDTRDYQTSLPGGGRQVGGTTALARLIGQLDVPALEPVPEDHVLTKAFYLLTSFPGRWDGGPMWVEAEPGTEQERADRARQTDGVSAILITSNDLAAAWALDERNRPMFPVVPGGEMQREMAYRVGVNVVMYALTGNYKADQVHVPALLERLGQ